MKIVPDFSTSLETQTGEHFTLDHRFDFIRAYPEINHAIVGVITETGVNRLHVSRDIGLMIAERSLIVCQDMDYIGEAEYERYLEVQTSTLSDDWLNS